MSVAAAKIDIVIQAGATWSDRIRYRVKSTGLPIDITGWSARLQVRTTLAAAETALDISTADDLTVNGPAGIVDIKVAAADTTPLAVENQQTEYVYGLELFRVVETIEEVIPLAQGKLTVTPEVVRG